MIFEPKVHFRSGGDYRKILIFRVLYEKYIPASDVVLQETAACHFLARNPRISTEDTGTHVSACLSTRTGMFRTLGPPPSHNRPTACIPGIILPTTGSTEVVTTYPCCAPSLQHSLYNDAGTFHTLAENTYSIHGSAWGLMDHRAGSPSHHFSSPLFSLVFLVDVKAVSDMDQGLISIYLIALSNKFNCFRSEIIETIEIQSLFFFYYSIV